MSKKNLDLRERLLKIADRVLSLTVLLVLVDFGRDGQITLPKVVALCAGGLISAGMFYVSYRLGKK